MIIPLSTKDSNCIEGSSIIFQSLELRFGTNAIATEKQKLDAPPLTKPLIIIYLALPRSFWISAFYVLALFAFIQHQGLLGCRYRIRAT